MYIHVADNLVCNLLFWLTKCQPCWSASLLQDSTLYLLIQGNLARFFAAGCHFLRHARIARFPLILLAHLHVRLFWRRRAAATQGRCWRSFRRRRSRHVSSWR
jgi:hypothetical protein